MPWKPNNAGQQMAQQAQQRAHRHNQQLARKQMQSLQDQWKARQAHIAAQMQARQQQEDTFARRDNEPRSRGEGWSSDPPDSIGSEVPFRRPPVPHTPFSSRSTIGIAEQVRLQAVPFNGRPAAKQSLTFRVAVMDRNGHPRGTIAVEMRSFRIQGNVENGDWVEIGRVSRSGKVTSFRNLSTGGQIRTRLW